MENGCVTPLLLPLVWLFMGYLAFAGQECTAHFSHNVGVSGTSFTPLNSTKCILVYVPGRMNCNVHVLNLSYHVQCITGTLILAGNAST